MTQPTLIYLHGGAGIFGSPDSLDPWHRELLEGWGFAVTAPDYPKVIGRTIHDTLAALEQSVTATAAESATGTVVVMGHSFGGYLALWLAATHPAVTRAVALAGYADLLAEWYLSPSTTYLRAKDLSGFLPATVTEASSRAMKVDLYLYLRQTGTWPKYVSGGDLESLAAVSPLHLPPAAVPVFLAHGTADTDVPYSASVAYFEYIAPVSPHSRLHLIPDGEHSVYGEMDNPAVVALWQAVGDFLGAGG
jgi:pimeloyl-ACP methyl ester carboxylesterase